MVSLVFLSSFLELFFSTDLDLELFFSTDLDLVVATGFFAGYLAGVLEVLTYLVGLLEAAEADLGYLLGGIINFFFFFL